MADLPPPFPESIDPEGHSDVSQNVQPVDEFGNTVEIPEFKEAPFLNGVFLTLIATLILSELSFVGATILKIHVADLYYPELSKINVTDPYHQHARLELAMASRVAGIVAGGGFLVLILTSFACCSGCSETTRIPSLWRRAD